jgi:hypothetical protein
MGQAETKLILNKPGTFEENFALLSDERRADVVLQSYKKITEVYRKVVTEMCLDNSDTKKVADIDICKILQSVESATFKVEIETEKVRELVDRLNERRGVLREFVNETAKLNRCTPSLVSAAGVENDPIYTTEVVAILQKREAFLGELSLLDAILAADDLRED